MRLLTRYILADLLRVFFLTTGVLVVVIAFGAAVKPLSDESLLSLSQTITYVGFAIVPMLQFAMPFSAGFAATMSMHRMATDNEIVALAACGVSYARVLRPVFILGLLLTAAMVGLTQWTVPHFWGLMEETLATDATRLFEASIRNGRAFQVGDLQIFADDIAIEPEPPDTDAQSRLILVGVAAIKLDKTHRVETEYTAAQAVVDIHRREGRTWLKLAMIDAVAYMRETGELVSMPQVRPGAVPLPSLINDDPVAMPRKRLVRLLRQPGDFYKVQARARAVAVELHDRAVWQYLDGRLEESGSLDLFDHSPAHRLYRVRADSVEGGAFRTDDRRPIVIEQIVDDRPTLRITTRSARLVGVESGGDPMYELVLTENFVEDLTSSDPGNDRETLVIPDLGPPAGTIEMDERHDIDALLAEASAVSDPRPRLTNTVRRLEFEIEHLLWSVRAQLYYRHALSATAILLILLGATLAIWRRNALPLSIYVLAFLPSAASLMFISGGEQMIQDFQPIGAVVMWTGNAAMLALLVFAYRRLAKN